MKFKFWSVLQLVKNRLHSHTHTQNCEWKESSSHGKFEQEPRPRWASWHETEGFRNKGPARSSGEIWVSTATYTRPIREGGLAVSHWSLLSPIVCNKLTLCAITYTNAGCADAANGCQSQPWSRLKAWQLILLLLLTRHKNFSTDFFSPLSPSCCEAFDRIE